MCRDSTGLPRLCNPTFPTFPRVKTFSCLFVCFPVCLHPQNSRTRGSVDRGVSGREGSGWRCAEPTGGHHFPEELGQEKEVLGGWTQSSGGTVCVSVCVKGLMNGWKLQSHMVSVASAVVDYSDWTECLSNLLCEHASGQRSELLAGGYTILYFIFTGKSIVQIHILYTSADLRNLALRRSKTVVPLSCCVSRGVSMHIYECSYMNRYIWSVWLAI